MDGTEFRFQGGDRVRLRDGVDPGFYDGMSVYGNEGWIDDRRRDSRFGLPEVHIKWDRNHWAYNGAPDKWTFEDHFDKVEEEPMAEPDKTDQLVDLFRAFLKEQGETVDQDVPEADDSEPLDLRKRLIAATQKKEPTEQERYDAALQKAANAMAKSEAFVVVGVSREEADGSAGLMIPYAIGYSKTPEAELLATTQMGKLASEAHFDLALQAIQDLSHDDAS